MGRVVTHADAYENLQDGEGGLLTPAKAKSAAAYAQACNDV